MIRNARLALVAVGWVLTLAPRLVAGAEPQRPNVLFIAVDDLRPTLGCYGDRVVKSPNIDKLAARGLVFRRAYCQQAVCSPSRSSLLTGCRPDTTRVYDLVTHFRTALPDVVTLPQHFKAHGYQCESMGKIYHGGYDDPPSWSVPSYWPGRGRAQAEAGERAPAKAKAKAKKAARGERGAPTQAPDVPDSSLADGQIADHAIERLRANKDRPFFLAVGFLKPHLPFVAPRKYWDLYDRNAFRLADNPRPPEGAPPYAGTSWGELRSYAGMPESGPLTDDQARTLIHGYHAAISFMDAQVGRVLDELDRLGLREKTVVVLWGDHGWHLGDHGFWCKHTNYETATRAALILSAPGASTAGRSTEALTEFVDIYPTLCDLCALPKPSHLEGTSAAPLVADPGRPWKRAAFSQYPRGIPGRGRGMGHALATERYRLVEWSLPGDPSFREVELYDHRADPEENVNIAGRPENAALVSELTDLLHGGWRGARP